MNPTPSFPAAPTDPTSPAAPPAAGQEVVEFVRGSRHIAAYVLLGLSVACLAAAIYMGVKGLKTTTADKPEATKSLDPDAPPEAPKPEVSSPKQRSYLVGMIGAALGFVVTGLAGGYLQARPPRPTPDAQRTEARYVILVVGGLLGAVLIVLGAAYIYLWSESLLKGLEAVNLRQLAWPLGALLGVVLGAGLVLAAVQPARAEERNNLTLRRLVYGSNFGVLVLLLLVVLVVVNVVVAKKVPNQLDTTETGFYTLADSTKNFLGKLPEPVTLYLIYPDSGEREANDLRQFVYSAQDASDGKLTAKFVSPVSNKAELARLQEKYPRLGRDARDALGILLTVGADEKRSAFVSSEDLFDRDPRTGQAKGFSGEAKVMRELRFLADNEQKPVIYFTQSNGELNIAGAAGAADLTGVAPTANQLKAFLEKNYLDVRPLTFPVKDPKVPDDAAVVVVAEPQSPFAPAAAAALRKYMTDRKGRLIVLAGAASGPDGRGVVKTGLEDLLKDFNVRLGDKFLYTVPTRDIPDHRLVVAIFNPNLQNPVAQTMSQQVQAMVIRTPREVAAAAGGNPQFQAQPLLFSMPGRFTWTEENPVGANDLEQILTELEGNEAVQKRKELSRGARSLGVVVSEGSGAPHGGPGGSGRLLVIGNGAMFSDRAAESSRGRSPVTFDLLTVAIDWLRDRPPLPTTVETKTYVEYKPPEPASVDTTRLLWLPLGLGLLLVTGLGAGVWVIRRK